MPAVLPPEWDVMSAKEQTIWYLESLIAKVEGMTTDLRAARGGDPPMNTPLVNPAPSAATATPSDAWAGPHYRLAAVAFTSSPTTGAVRAARDGKCVGSNTTYIARAPVTYSTDGSTQTVDVAKVDEVHGATTTVRPEPVVDLNDKEVEEPFPAPATASSTAASAMPRALPSTTAIECQEGLVAVHDTSAESIAVASMSCSTNCSNQVVDALSLTPPITPMPLLPTTTPTFVTDSDSIPWVLPAVGMHVLTQAPRVVPVMYLLQLFADRDISYQKLILRPTPWPSFLVDQADAKVIRSMPWPPFPCSPEGVTPKHAGVLPQVTYVMNYLTGNLNSVRASSRYLASLQLKSCLFEKVACWIPPMPIDIQVPSELIMPMMDDIHLCATERWPGFFYVQPSHGFHAQDAQPLFTFSQETTLLKPPWPSFSCNCQTVQVQLELPNGELPDDCYSRVVNFCSSEHQFLVDPEHFSELVDSFRLEKLWRTSDIFYITQIMSMTVHWQFFSQEGCKQFLGFALGWVALTSSHICHSEHGTEIFCFNQVIVPTISANYGLAELWLACNLAGRMLKRDELLTANGAAGLESDFSIYLSDFLSDSPDINQAGYFCSNAVVTNQTLRSILFREESLHSDLLSNKASDQQHRSKLFNLTRLHCNVISDVAVGPQFNMQLHGYLRESFYNKTTSLPAYQTLLWFGDSYHFSGCISISATCNPSGNQCNELLAHVYVSTALHCPWDPGDEQWNSRGVSTQYGHAWMCSSEQHGIISVSDTSQVTFSTAGAPVHSCATAKQDHCHLDCVRAICAQDHCHLDIKDFYELSSTNGCLTSELPLRNVSYELLELDDILPYLDRRMGISWDPKGLALILSLELAHPVAFKSGACVIILVVHYLAHASYISLHRLPGLQLNQAHFQEGRNIMEDIVSPDQVAHGSHYSFNHDPFSEHVQVHLNHDYYRENYHGAPVMVKDLQAPWDPGELLVMAAWGQAAFQEGRDVTDPSYMYVGLPMDSHMGRA